MGIKANLSALLLTAAFGTAGATEPNPPAKSPATPTSSSLPRSANVPVNSPTLVDPQADLMRADSAMSLGISTILGGISLKPLDSLSPPAKTEAAKENANRCVLNYIREGHLMLAEGVPAAMIENMAKKAGMPVGPLSLNDEVALDLGWKILQATKKDLGPEAVDAKQEALLKTMVVDLERFGRKNGKGFYDYAPTGKKLWPGLAKLQAVKLKADSIDKAGLVDRLLVVQALEAARTVEEKVITDVREADVGAILAWGFAPWTGGPITMIDQTGLKAFVAQADDYAAPETEDTIQVISMGKAERHEREYYFASL